MSSYDLKWFESEVIRLAAIIAAPAKLLPTFGRSEDGARPNIKFDGVQFHFVVEERGQELERKSSPDPQEILYRAFEAVTFSMACAYEVRHRIAGQDFRRQLFAVQLDLLGKLSPQWQQRTRARLDEVLAKHPFDDEQKV